MADDPNVQQPPPDPNAPQTPTGTPDAPISVTIVGAGGLPGGPVYPTPGIDETVEGGAYRFANLDGSSTWKDAEGREIKAPRGRGR